MEKLIESVYYHIKLPNSPLLLTFDDGLKDHYDFVFPLLDELGIQGSFFPPAKAIQNNQVLDVNKIQFILAAFEDKNQLIMDIYSEMDKFREEYSLRNKNYYENKISNVKYRYDTKEVIFINGLLTLFSGFCHKFISGNSGG
jgi:hypothetical protein